MASTATANRESINDQLRIRRVANQLSRVGLVLLGALTPVVFIVAFVQAFLWLQQPVFLGVFVEYPTLVERGAAQPFFGEAEEVQDSALQQGDTILSMNGVSVANGRQIMDVLENRSPGDQVVLDVGGADGNRRTIDVTLSPIPFSRTLLVFSLLSVAALGHIGLGLWVSRQRRGQPVGRIFLMYSLAGCILLIGLFDLWTAHTLVPVWLTALTLMGVLLLSLALIFPGELVPVARQPMLRFVPPLLAVP
ncbi:MAG: hypothetical protein ACFB51_11795, partial [Anaerolineae bacterium]